MRLSSRAPRPAPDRTVPLLVPPPAVLPPALRRVLGPAEPAAMQAALARLGWALAVIVIAGGGISLWQLLLPGPVLGENVRLGAPSAPALPHSAQVQAPAAVVDTEPGGGPARPVVGGPPAA